jgi:hypothetical protein
MALREVEAILPIPPEKAMQWQIQVTYSDDVVRYFVTDALYDLHLADLFRTDADTVSIVIN